MRVAFCVSGNGSLFRAAARSSSALGIEPALLLLDTHAAPDLEEAASELDVPIVRLSGADRGAVAGEMAAALEVARPDLISLTFDRILPAYLVERFPHRIINVHPGLLPAFAGRDAIARTLVSGMAFGGATVHEVIEAVDAGPVIAQAVVPLHPDDTVESLGRRLYGVLEPMYLDVLRWYASDRIDRSVDGRIVVRGARYGSWPTNPSDR